MMTTILLAGCSNTKQHQTIPAYRSDAALVDKDMPSPKGETHKTGFWIGSKGSGYFWKRTSPIKEYDRIGIPKKYAVGEYGETYLNIDNLPKHLRERYDAVHTDGNNYDKTPNYYQEVYDALCGTLKPKEAVRFLKPTIYIIRSF